MYARVGQWKRGMNDIVPDKDVPEDALRLAINVDMTDAGRARIRRGHDRIYAGNIVPHTLWGDASGLVCFVEDGDLKRIRFSDPVTTPTPRVSLIRAGVGYNPMGYLWINGAVYYSNGTVNGRIFQGADTRWSAPTPTVAPDIQVVTGNLTAGQYNVAVAFMEALTGEEGALGDVTTVNVPEDGSGLHVRYTGTVLAGYVPIVYVSSPGSSSLYLQGYEGIITDIDTSSLCQHFGLEPMPKGKAIAYYNGRLFVADDDVVWFSEPWNFGLCNMEENYYQFASPVDVLVDVPDSLDGGGGIYVSADRLYFISGPGKPTAREIESFPYKGARYSGIRHPNSPMAAWVTEAGVALGERGGQVKLLTESNLAGVLALSDAEFQAAMFYRDFCGQSQYIATLTGAGPSPHVFP